MSAAAPAADEIPAEAKPLTEAEQTTFDEVKKLLGDRVVDELMLIQFVRGYSYEKEWVPRVHEMITKALDWRAEHQIDTICQRKLDKRDDFKTTWITMVTGEDAKGRLITVDCLGAIDPGSLLTKFTVEELQLHHAQNQEYICKMKRRACAKHGLRMYKTISIVDLNGVGMGHASGKFTGPARSVTDIDQWFYPESLHKMYVVNVPWVFKAIWAIVRPWLHPITQTKIHVCGSGFLDELAADGITKDKLPQCLGGTATDHLAEFEVEYIAKELWKHEHDDAAGKKKKKKTKKKKADGASEASLEGTEEGSK